jgi:hypothetical protein
VELMTGHVIFERFRRVVVVHRALVREISLGKCLTLDIMWTTGAPGTSIPLTHETSTDVQRVARAICDLEHLGGIVHVHKLADMMTADIVGPDLPYDYEDRVVLDVRYIWGADDQGRGSWERRTE